MPDGSPDTNPALTRSDAMHRGARAEHAINASWCYRPFTPLLGCYDLTRTAPLPLSDGCPAGQTTSGLYPFYGHTDIKETALYRPGLHYGKELEF